jgi:gluconate transporter
MPANATYLLLVTAAAIALLFLLILRVKLHAFLVLVICSMAMGLAAGMPPDKVLRSIQAGFGDALGFITVVVGLGAMIGAYLEYSGGGRVLADWLLERFGKERAGWAMLAACFLVGLPIFFEVGFIIMVPLVWSLARESKRSLLYYGMPMAGALTIAHGLVPPHPAPAAAAQLLGADLGRSILYSIALSIPMAVVSGMGYGNWIAKRMYVPLPEIAAHSPAKEGKIAPPAVGTVVFLLLLPVVLIFGATVASLHDVPLRGVAVFVGHPFSALLITALLALWLFGTRRGLTRDKAMSMAADCLAPMGALLCIMGGGGAFKQIIVDSGVGTVMGRLLVSWPISPLIVVFVIALAMRIAMGSATVAIITTAGIVAPMVKGLPGYSPEMIMLALCCGGTGPSHVNDSGFWIVNQYFGMSVAQTMKSWTVMKVISGFVGLAIVLAIQALIR